jgi:L-amino acid N-acyltransferase YncA
VATVRGRSWPVAVDVTSALGYADFNRFRDCSGDRFTAESGVYAREKVRSQGVGKERLARPVEIATRTSFRQMATVIGDSAKVGSVGVHASVGFRPAGTPRAARLKSVQWLDSVYWILSRCGAHSDTLARPSSGDAAASA